ncbi:conserved hypothetical protein [Theileria orientalis strain Shintoku]|uniref:Signal peptide-containing protein n=1 Tax=Theileria orientalis strain Shintoku TaxID=869250 RepID=J4DNX2_THEOR|nr:conserved hypothetical protein [Theileria orientalis strain Shintoku]PVC52474.1 hypothetical protein MACL_00000738 [Theileria orientalis]BAM39704.1 conserved hypothetical protein [Theileria orientalis strain Shintoku]|eukprot:XP_009690005.1 conserved hypothetical protein [Theileria orientalis strain Shintoku]
MQCVATLIIALLTLECRAEKMAQTLDISKNLDDEMFRMEPIKDEGEEFIRYTPKRSFIIARVIQDYNFIWQRLSYKQQCLQVDVYKSNDKPFLIYMKVVKPDEEWNLYFMNTISTWTPITYSDFKDALNKRSSRGFLGLFKRKKGSFLSLSTHLALLISLLSSLHGIT